MAAMVHGILLSWLALVPLAFFGRTPRHLVAGAAMVFGLLFLPMVADGVGAAEAGAFAPITVPGLVLAKYKVISLAVLLGVILAEGTRLLRARPSWVDLPMAAWCICPLLSVLGAPPPPDGSEPLVAGLNLSAGAFLLWGVPYFVGRYYFGIYARQCDLAALFLLGGVLYVPLCLYEVRMSPQLHSRLYGFSQHDFGQTVRFDGFRPMVFMQHGLAVGLFLVGATLAGSALCAGGGVKYLPLPSWVRNRYLLPCLVALLLVTTVLTKSTGALALGVAGLGVMACALRFEARWLLVGLAVLSPLYLVARTSRAWQGSDLVPFLKQNLGEERAQSFEFRQTNEEVLMDRAFEGPPFGWAGWGRNLIDNPEGRQLTTPDGLWIITLGERGLPGLVLLYLAMLVPVLRFLWLRPPSPDDPRRERPGYVCATGSAVVVLLYMVDNLMNNMHNHVFIMMAGGLAGLGSAALPREVRGRLPITDPRVFQWSLLASRLRRSRGPAANCQGVNSGDPAGLPAGPTPGRPPEPSAGGG